MLDIQWKGKIGYGDVVSPICYAHNISYKLKIPVNLTFRWEWGHGRKIHPSDPEQLWLRSSHIFSKAFKKNTDVTLIHKFRDPLSCNHTGYVWEDVAKDKFHNYWYSTYKRNPKKGTIVVNSTEGNLLSLAKYGKSWKDPVAENWRSAVDELRKKYKVSVVDYRTSLDQLCDLLNECECFIGYHGTAAWIAKFLETPSIIYSSGGTITKNAFHSAVIISRYKGVEHLIHNLNPYIEKAIINIEQDREAYKTYTPGFKLL
jgi:hypothetical protein